WWWWWRFRYWWWRRRWRRRWRGCLDERVLDADAAGRPTRVLWPLIIFHVAGEERRMRSHIRAVPTAKQADGECRRQVEVNTAADREARRPLVEDAMKPLEPST